MPQAETSIAFILESWFLFLVVSFVLAEYPCKDSTMYLAVVILALHFDEVYINWS